MVGERLARRKIERWARGNGFELFEFKGAPAWRGPRAWTRTENQEDYHIVVQDAAGMTARRMAALHQPVAQPGAPGGGGHVGRVPLSVADVVRKRSRLRRAHPDDAEAIAAAHRELDPRDRPAVLST